MGNLQLWLWIALFAGLVVAQHAKNSTEPVTKTNSTGASAPKSSAAGGPTANSNSSGSNASSDYYDSLDFRYAYFDMVALAALVFVLFLWNSSIGISGHLRRLVSLNNETQRYFTRGDSRIAWLKEHIIYAPLFRTRHNREFQLSRAVNMGILPSRFQSLVFTALLFLNVFYCVVNIPFSQPMKTTATLVRNRTGTIATINMIPLVILAGRNNPLIPLLRISFDTCNFFHRSLARIVVLESIAHVISWVVPKVQAQGGWAAIPPALHAGGMVFYGLVAVCGFLALTLHSFSAFRHAFYETFLHCHIALVIVVAVTLWLHLDGFQAQLYLLIALVFWGLERFTRLAILLFRNFGKKNSVANIQALPGDAMRITLKVARPWTFRPGQYVYLYIPSIGWWTSHPFSVAWSETEQTVIDEKGIVMTQQDVLALQKTTVSLLVRRRTGFTDQLYERAEKSPDGQLSLRAFVEGPYGGIHNLSSYGTVLMFAGGVGITHHVPFVRQLVAGFTTGTVAARRVTLVWVIQSPEHLEWIRPWMTTILGMDRRREILRIMLFITRPRNTKEIHSPSTTVQMFPGRPNPDTLIDMEIENQVGAMGVLVCGTGSLSDDVRRVCRRRQATSNIDFLEESFSW